MIVRFLRTLMQSDDPSVDFSSLPRIDACPAPIAFNQPASPFTKEVRWSRLNLSLKTTLILLLLLCGLVSVCGLIFVRETRLILRRNEVTNLGQFADGVAAAMANGSHNSDTDVAALHGELQALGKIRKFEFAVLTDVAMTPIAEETKNSALWKAYMEGLGQSDHEVIRHMGQVQEINIGGQNCYVTCVPVFYAAPSSQMFGYLHLAESTDRFEDQIRMLEGFVIVTCMAAVVVALPLASLVVRHLTVPIQRLAEAAHALATGDLLHRVDLKRSDELGELCDAFNQMADTVELHQRAIRQINAGLEQKVHQRTQELEKVNTRLKAEMAEKEEFLRAVSHDLNAPLRNIAGLASMLLRKYGATLEKDALLRLERIEKNVEIECELINELLELSRIKSRREKIERVDLGLLLQATVDGFSCDLETRNIELHVEGEFPVMNCEKSRLRQVFQNLIDNAIKYMREEGTRDIVIRAETGTDDVTFSVADTGMGISSEDVPHLFHIFRRAKNASIAKIPGKGVGLASVKSIVENYNGRLWVKSTPKVGTVFYFAIPIVYFDVAVEAFA